MNNEPIYNHEQIIDAIKSFINLLNEEYQAILNHQIEKLDEFTRQKEAFLNNMQLQQAQIHQIFREFPDHKEAILKLSQEFEQLNQRNGTIIQGYLNQLNRVLNIVYGKEDVCYKKP